VHIPELSGYGDPILEVSIDGRRALRQPLPRDTEQPWSYWKSFTVPVSAGEHTVAVSNAGTGAFWTGYELCNYLPREGPDLDVAGIYTDDTILLWLRNPEFVWVYLREGRKPKERAAGRLTLEGVSNGAYTVVWRETTTGEVLATTRAEAKDGVLTLATPAITRSAVAKLVRRQRASSVERGRR